MFIITQTSPPRKRPVSSLKATLPIVNEFLSYGTIRKKRIGSYVMYYLPDAREKTSTYCVYCMAAEIWMSFFGKWTTSCPHNEL